MTELQWLDRRYCSSLHVGHISRTRLTPRYSNRAKMSDPDIQTVVITTTMKQITTLNPFVEVPIKWQ